ncbi:MAG TPA: aminotransferase class V-fold PLP-dependent enzyme [Terriglobia bacterium]|nr:aminotransferase class V-fold PLP-dependent enzyme [Terriglobia bacterium]
MNLDDLLKSVAERSAKYLAEIRDRQVFPNTAGLEALPALGGELPEEGQSAEDVLALLDEAGSPATVASTGARYFGFVTGGTLHAALAANWLAGAWDQNAGLRVQSPVGTYLEEVCLAWLREILKLPSGTGVGFVTGATMANFTGLLAARHAVMERSGWDVERNGLFGAPPITVVVGDEVHASLLRALSMLGLGRDRVVRVPTDNQGRMIASALPRIVSPAIVCIQAGNVNTGACDPAAEICDVAHESNAWVHVDGAFGLWAAASPKRAHLVSGVDKADSWATDCHKWLNVPQDSGLAFVRDAGTLETALQFSAAYLATDNTREPMRFTPEMSRRARGVEVWAALRFLGKRGLAEMIERTCSHASTFASRLKSAGCTILNDVVLNQVLVSFGSDERTKKIIAAIQNEGTCWFGGTVWQGRAAMRISVSSWATTGEDVEKSVAAILKIASEA